MSSEWPNPLDSPLGQLLRTVASDSSTSERADPSDVQETRRGGLETLLELTRMLSSGLDRDELLDSILDAVMSLGIADRSVLVLREGSDLRIVRERGREVAQDAAHRLSETLVRRCLEHDASQFHSDLSRQIAIGSRSIAELGLQSAVCIPLRENGVPFGVLYMDSDRLNLSRGQQETRLLEAFAAQAALCLAHSRMHSQIKESNFVLSRENEELRARVAEMWKKSNLIGQSESWLRVLERVQLVKDVDNPVLLRGETGTGKEEVARLLHGLGSRKTSPFVSYDCAAVPENLMEAQLFGVRRGAFTDAREDRPGFVERADGGILFLDEIGDLAPTLQSKLLRFLDTQRFVRLGETVERTVDVRIVSATSRDLDSMRESGSFRSDLYYRLHGIPIELPPLRERKGDLPLLIDSFFARFAGKMSRSVRPPTQRAIKRLLEHAWPGNIRELRNVIEGACTLVPDGAPLDLIHVEAILGCSSSFSKRTPTSDRRGTVPANPFESPAQRLSDVLQETEKELVRRALERHEWRVAGVADELEVSRQHIYNLIRQHKLRNKPNRAKRLPAPGRRAPKKR